jgi:BolA protein
MLIVLPLLAQSLKQNRWYNAKNRYNYRLNSIVENQDTVVGRCTTKIQAALNPTMIQVTASNDDPNGSHIQIVCVSKEFEGKNTLARQRMIYKAIWDEMAGPVHACDSIVAKTPTEMDQ